MVAPDTGSNGSPPKRLQGSVERVSFHSPDSGFCVLRIKVPGRRELVTVVGSAASVSVGEYLECIGAWINDRRHGLQFKARDLRVIPPSTLEGIEKGRRRPGRRDAEDAHSASCSLL